MKIMEDVLMLEVVAFIATVLAVYGVLLNNRKSSMCFKLWIVSNLLSAGIHCFTGPVMLVIRDLIFLILAFEGMILWRSDVPASRDERSPPRLDLRSPRSKSGGDAGKNET
jgi:nicotinamide riboside transporter PnuC